MAEQARDLWGRRASPPVRTAHRSSSLVPCEKCGRTFPRQSTRSRFCSKECRVEAEREQHQASWREGSVYIVSERDTGNIKVGWAIDVEARLEVLQGANGSELNLIANRRLGRLAMSVERIIHHALRHHRRIGKEWFDAPALAEACELLEWFDSKIN